MLTLCGARKKISWCKVGFVEKMWKSTHFLHFCEIVYTLIRFTLKKQHKTMLRLREDFKARITPLLATPPGPYSGLQRTPLRTPATKRPRSHSPHWPDQHQPPCPGGRLLSNSRACSNAQRGGRCLCRHPAFYMPCFFLIKTFFKSYCISNIHCTSRA